jgi:NurA-like 5'-3' nuclease
MELISEIAGQVLGKAVAEHWYMRLPIESIDNWAFSLAQERRIPPVGAVSYLFRLHENTPIMRLDMDFEAWKERIKDNQEAEAELFSELDYTGHDQRAYGYPYPIKASHDRSRLTQMERAALRKQIIDAAVAAGMKRALFRDVSSATGHK